MRIDLHYIHPFDKEAHDTATAEQAPVTQVQLHRVLVEVSVMRRGVRNPRRGVAYRAYSYNYFLLLLTLLLDNFLCCYPYNKTRLLQLAVFAWFYCSFSLFDRRGRFLPVRKAHGDVIVVAEVEVLHFPS